MEMLKAILDCFTDGEGASTVRSSNDATLSEEDDRLASDIIDIIFTAEKPGKAIKAQLNGTMHTDSWYEGIAKRILNHLIAALNSGRAMGAAMKDAFDRASAAADKFVREHPVFAAAIVTVVAVGILVLLVPWVIEALGFGEFGPAAGT